MKRMMIYHATLPQLIFCMLYWLLAYTFYSHNLLLNISKYKYNQPSNTSLFFFWIVITIYATFEFAGGDFFHYMEFYETQHIKGENDGLDPIYLWLIDNLPHNFYIWRFVVWGSASFLWVLIIRTMNQNLKLAATLFFVVVFFLFVGARQSLGFSMLYLGATLILKPINKLGGKLLGVLLFGLSYFFHSTLIVYMLLLLIAFIPFFNKRIIICSIILFPIIYKLMDSSAFLSIINNLPFLQDESADKMTRYVESDYRVYANIFGILRLIIARTPIWLLLIYSMKKIFWDKEETSNTNKVFLRMTYILIYISYLFAGKEVSSFIAPRFWDAALFPFTLFLTNFIAGRRMTPFLKCCFIILFINVMYTYSYSIYKLFG